MDDSSGPVGDSERKPIDSELVLRLGEQAGLTRCGIADCSPSRHAQHLDAWLASGSHASMAWMQRTADIRKDLKSKWTWANTALVGTLSYLTRPLERRELDGIARYISRYARGQDYHDVLKARLRHWAELLEERVEARFVPLVDTSAVLERELAARAGLGWFGKNTCLIGPEGDSWFFVGILLTDLELTADAPALPERCGSCVACIDACPTDAITPWAVDARRCISYLTIEHRAVVAPELAEKSADWLFGCDICQEVCPWNRRATPADEPELQTNPDYERISLAELAVMSDTTFRETFRKTPLSRPKRSGMIRNALIVAANVGDRDALKAAQALTTDEDPVVAATARWALDTVEGEG